MNILVTGGSGQLAWEIKQICSEAHQLLLLSKAECNIASRSSLTKIFETNKIDYVINCAAYTAVDKAESEINLAEEINISGVKNLVEECSKKNLPLVHISTDFVFDGLKNTPYVETDAVNPKSVYGRTKEEGEKFVLNYKQSFVIRTSWLYSSYGKNFFNTMCRLGTEKKYLSVVSDQIGTPTYARDLARFILESIISTNNYGLYHFSNEGVASWYDFAHEIMAKIHSSCKVLPISTKEYPTPAVRPHYSVLDKSKCKKVFNIEIRHWKDALGECVKEAIL